MDAIRQVLGQVIRQMPATARSEAALLAWPLVAGATIAARSRAERLEIGATETTLCVSVADLAWQRQLQAVTAELLAGLNELLGAEPPITRLSFVLSGEAAAPPCKES